MGINRPSILIAIKRCPNVLFQVRVERLQTVVAPGVGWAHRADMPSVSIRNRHEWALPAKTDGVAGCVPAP